jgi:hypothetical protein
MPARRFPPPWSVDDPDPKLGRQCFIIRDHNGQALAYVCFEDEPGRRSAGASHDPRRGAADSRQHRQAAGAAAAVLTLLWRADADFAMSATPPIAAIKRRSI